MRWTRWVAWCSFVAALLGAVLVVSCANYAKKPEMTQAEKIARGKILMWTSGCNDCHTPGTLFGSPDTTRLLSGSELGWAGPWGVSYPRNLTPDMATGIGSWTEEQIVTATRTGQRPDKTSLLPPMPWPSYAFMPDDDAYAIAAYLKSIPAVAHQAPDRIPPGVQPTGAVLVFPPPPAWDAQRGMPPGGGGADTGSAQAH